MVTALATCTCSAPKPFIHNGAIEISRTSSQRCKLGRKGMQLSRHVVGLFMYFTRLADGFGLPLDEPIAEAGRKETRLRRPGEAGEGVA